MDGIWHRLQNVRLKSEVIQTKISFKPTSFVLCDYDSFYSTGSSKQNLDLNFSSLALKYPPLPAVHVSPPLPRTKSDPPENDASSCKNSYNNPAYYILEGVPNQSAALAPDLLPSSSLTPLSTKGAAPPGGKNKAPAAGGPQRRQTSGRPARPVSEEMSSEDDVNLGAPSGTLNRPPPDFPPPPLPKGAIEITENPFFGISKEGAKGRNIYPDLADMKISAKPGASSGAFCLEPSPMLSPPGGHGRRGPVSSSGVDDQSCSVLQMAKTLSEVEYPPGRDRTPGIPHRGVGGPSLRATGLPESCRTFPPRSIHESIAEDLPEEVTHPYHAM